MPKPTMYQMLEYLGINLTPEMKKILSTLKKGEVEENKLAELLKVRVNDIRKLMYELSHKSFVKYKKIKSEDKQWWYVYLWELDLHKIEGDYIYKKRKKLSDLQSQLEQDQSQTFRCGSCDFKVTPEEAIDVGYICPQCNCPLAEIKRHGSGAQIEREIKELKTEINALEKGKK